MTTVMGDARQEVGNMATTNRVKYYQTWDNLHRRYLVKATLDDEWELSHTPQECCTKGRTFNPKSGAYSLPFSTDSNVPRIWDETNGRWIFEITMDMEKKEDNKSNDGEDNGVNTSVGVNITSVRKKYI